MKKLVLPLILILLLAGAAAAGGAGETGADPGYTTSQGLQRLMDSGESFLLLDVRTPEEFRDGYIPGALNIPYEQLPGAMPEGEKNELVILYCRSGNRAGIARKALEAAGYTNVHNFGGLSKWQGPVLTP